MRVGVTASAIAHAALIAFGLVSLGTTPLRPEVVESISVDLIPITEFTNIRAGTLDSAVIETDTPAVVEDDAPAELAQPTGNTEQDQEVVRETPEPTPVPVTNTAPEPVPEPSPDPLPTPAPVLAPVPAPPREEPVPEPQPEPVPPAPEPEPEPTPAPAAPEPAPTPAPPEPTPVAVTPVEETPTVAPPPVPVPVTRTAALEQKRAEFRQQQAEAAAAAAAQPRDAPQAREADDISDIINNEDSRGAVTGSGGEPTTGRPTGTAATLTQSERAALVAQIRACMSVPPGSLEAGVTAQLQFSLAQDGNLRGDPQLVRAPTSQLEDAFARAAIRAVKRCGPYTVAAGQDISALFDPREF